ncbi:MAG: serine--tRNA ligase [Labilithrix sp.]|nr:serine--tRNA ligase [Labilithrix sp.]
MAVSRARVLDPGPQPFTWAHPLHDPARAWPETNCYVDLWIEVLHALSLDPVASFGFTLSTDFEGDQWTFFKPPLADLYDLYGVDVQELTIWRPVLDHLREQVGRKRLVLVEVDSFHLPDLHATDYRKNHAKTTIAVESLDEEEKRLGYFHNASYHELEREDFEALFESALPPYTEFVKLDRVVRRSHDDLVARAAKILKRELERRPRHNPLSAFRERFPVDAAWLAERDLAAFHAYAFATIRQLGACFELAAEHLRWLDRADPVHAGAAEQLEAISTGAKALLFKVARMVNGKKKPNFDETLATMEAAWARAMETIAARYGA